MFRDCLVLVFCLLLIAPVQAQAPLDPAAQPEFGGLVLAPGFQPDPQRAPVVLVGGGDVDVISRALGPDCMGFISQAPDFRVTLTAPAERLRLIFIADAVTNNTAMVVALPDGRYLCGDNYGGLLNPLVDALSVPAGDYAVWIAGFTPGAPVYGTLYVTSRGDVVPESAGLFIPPAAGAASAGTPTPAPGTFLDASAAPTHGSVALAHGFLPDPFWALAIGGGFLAVPPLDGAPAPSSTCGGFTTGEPDFRLTWSGASPRLRLHFLPAAQGASEPNAALIVRGPDGTFRCNRDFAPGFTRPSVEFVSPLPGDYAVWVAAESAPGDLLPGLLYVTELTSTPETVASAATIALDSLNGPVPADAGPALIFDFGMPDPLTTVLSAEQIGPGSVDLAALNPAALAPDGQRLCEGFVSPQPTMTISLPLPYPYLRLFFIASDPAQDTVMVVRMPDGRWYCSDDAMGTLNPQVDVLGSMTSGAAQVWIGGFEAGARIAGTLYATRGQASVAQPEAAFDGSGLSAFAASLPPTPDPLQPPALPSTEPVIQNALPTPEGAQALAAALLDPYAATNYGEATLISALAPHTVQGIAGGSVDASALGGGCTGWVSTNADYRVYWSGGFGTLRFFFVGDADSTLIVLGPDGVLRCSDDSFGSFNPTVDFPSAQPGAYHVWLGSFAQGSTALGTLTVTEDLSRSPATP